MNKKKKMYGVASFKICPHGRAHFLEDDDGLHGSNLPNHDNNMCTPKSRCCDKEIILYKIGKQRTWSIRKKKL